MFSPLESVFILSVSVEMEFSTVSPKFNSSLAISEKVFQLISGDSITVLFLFMSISDDAGLEKGMKSRVKCKQSLLYYFKHNIHVTTSGHYSDEGLKLCMDVYVSYHRRL